jgi:hypothetical protein
MLYLLSLIKRWTFNLLNFLLGKTKIFIIILAWFLIITGALFLFNPEKARNNLLGYGFGFFKWPIRILAIYLAMIFISFGLKTPGILAFILPIAAIVFIVWFWRFLKKKTYNKLSEHFAKIPLSALKIFAVIQITVGSLMLILQRRIW